MSVCIFYEILVTEFGRTVCVPVTFVQVPKCRDMHLLVFEGSWDNLEIPK